MTAREKIIGVLDAHGADCALFLDDVSRQYLTRFAFTDGAVVADRNGTRMLVGSRYFFAAKDAAARGALFDDVQPELFESSLIDALSPLNGKRVLLDSGRITVRMLERLRASLPGSEFVTADGVCDEARRIKDGFELERIKRAQSITDAAFAHILTVIKRGMTEKQVAAELEYFCRRSGADGMAFDTIAVSGLKSAYPHGVPGDEPLSDNAFITMDFGAKVDGYCSDMTRTVVLGKADGRMKEIYATVLEAQRRAIEAVHAGVTGAQVDGAARSYIDGAGYRGAFGHSTGHSLGLEIHERPAFSSANHEPVAAGTVMTAEPGIYIEGVGGVRIEDMVVVTDGGCEDLTASPKELIEL